MIYEIYLKRKGRRIEQRFSFRDFIIVQQFARAFTQCVECSGIRICRVKENREETIWRFEGDALTTVPEHIPWNPVHSAD